MLEICFVAFLLIMLIILIKYKPQYELSLNNKKIGYINSQSDIDKYIEEKMQNIDGNIAFIELKNVPELKLKLVSRSLDNKEDEIKEEISNNLYIEYTNYAIAIDGENKAYVSSEEEAQNIVEEIKKEYPEKYTDKLTILQVYSEDNLEISAIEQEKAKDIINTEISNLKKSNNSTVKLASTSRRDSKKSNVKGINFSVQPVSGTITSRFGRRSSPGGIGSTNHKGLDIAAKYGSTIKATASGTVIYSGYKGSLGKLIIIDHGNGVKTYYGHCSKLIASVGDEVSAGEKIAEVGKTGSATGYHLHFEVRVDDVSVNPQRYIY